MEEISSQVEEFKARVDEYTKVHDESVKGMETYIRFLLSEENLIPFSSKILSEGKRNHIILLTSALRYFITLRFDACSDEIKEQFLEILISNVKESPEKALDIIPCISCFLLHDISRIVPILDFFYENENPELLYELLISLMKNSAYLGKQTKDECQGVLLEKSLSFMELFEESSEHFFNLLAEIVDISPDLNLLTDFIDKMIEASSQEDEMQYVLPVIDRVFQVCKYSEEEEVVIAGAINCSFNIINNYGEESIDQALIQLKTTFDHEPNFLFADEFTDYLAETLEIIKYCISNCIDNSYFRDFMSTLSSCYNGLEQFEEGSDQYEFTQEIIQYIGVMFSYGEQARGIFHLSDIARTIGDGVNEPIRALIENDEFVSAASFIVARVSSVDKEIVNEIAQKIVENGEIDNNFIYFITAKGIDYPKFTENYLGMLQQAPDELHSSAVRAFEVLLKESKNMEYVDGNVIKWIESGTEELDLSESNEVLQCLYTIMIAKEESREELSNFVGDFVCGHLSSEFETGDIERMKSAVQSINAIISGFNESKAVADFFPGLLSALNEFVFSNSSREDELSQSCLTYLLDVLVMNGADKSSVNSIIVNGLQAFPVTSHIMFYRNHLDLLDEEVIGSIHECDLQDPRLKLALLYLVNAILSSPELPDESKLDFSEHVFPREEVYKCINNDEPTKISNIAISDVLQMIFINSDIVEEALPHVIALASTSQDEQTFFNAIYLLALVSASLENGESKENLIKELLSEFQGDPEEIVALMQANEEEVNTEDFKYNLLEAIRKIIMWRKDNVVHEE